MLPLMCACINGLINSANAGDLRRHDARVTSLQWCPRISQNNKWCFSIKSRLVAIWISIIKIRLSHNRAIFIMWILYPKRLSLYRNELLVFPHTAYIKWGSLTHWDRVTHVFSCLRLRQWPVTYLITLSDWIMSCQPGRHAVVTVCEPDWKHKWVAYKSFDETSSFNNL